MRRSIATALFALTTFALPGAGAAETIDQAYARGLQDYLAGRYQAAVERFERVAAVPTRHEDLYYNLGCAYYRLGRLGPAIYSFERSLLLDAEREDARFNLETARALVSTRIKDVLKGVPSNPWWAQLVSPLSLSGWWGLFVVLWWLLFGLLFFLRRVEPGAARAGLIAASALVALLVFAAGGGLAIRTSLAHNVVSAVILPDKVAVHEGASRATRASFELHAGLKVQLQAESTGWVRIRLANGLEGWVERSQLGVL